MKNPNPQRDPWNLPPDVAAMIARQQASQPDGSFARWKTCTARELEHLTGQGWTLMAIRSEERLTRDVYDQNGNYYSNNYRSYGADAAPVLAETLVFVVARRRDREFEALREKLAAAHADASDSVRKAVDADTRIGKLEGDVKRLNEALAGAQTLAAREKKAATDALEAAHRLEVDLAKVRRELGEKEWKRITGET